MNLSIFLPVLFSASVVSAEAPKYVEGEVIVKFKAEGLRSQDISALQNQFSIASAKRLSGIGVQLWEVSGDTKNIIQQLNQNNSIEYAEPNFFIKLETSHNYYGGKVDAIESWQNRENSKDTVIAVIDTGVDYTHTDLAANMWRNEGEIPNNGKDDDGNGYIDDVYGYDFHNNDGDPFDDNYHGTHIAGTVASVNPNAKIMALKFLDADGVGTLSDVIKAINYAADMGAKVSNNSWACADCKSQALYDSIKAAGEKGHLFVVAAGNMPFDNDTGIGYYPTSYDLDNIIAVAATDENNDLAEFSGYGATTVDLGAPGVNIYSTVPGNSYKYLDGTSMASPYVAGAVSLMLSKCPDLESNVLKQVMMKTVDPRASLDGKTVTGGRVNIDQALQHEAMRICENRDITPPRSFDVCGAGSIAEFTYTNNGSFGEIKLPFLIQALIGRNTGIGLFENAKLDVQLNDGSGDFNIFLDFNPNSLVKTLSKPDLDDQNYKCYAVYDDDKNTLHLPILGFPQYVTINDGIVMLENKNWYEMDLRLSQADKPTIVGIKHLSK
jgi:hypothetical protein